MVYRRTWAHGERVSRRAGRSDRGHLRSEVVDAPGEDDVEVGHAAFRMGRAGERDPGPSDVDVRVVVHAVGNLGNRVDEPDAGRKVGGLDSAPETAGVALPPGEIGQGLGNVVGAQELGHVPTVVRRGRPVKSGQGRVLADFATVRTGPQVVVAAALIDGDRLLAAQRAAPPALAGRWELPGGKVDAGETDQAALSRECREELGVDVILGPRIGRDWPIGEHAVLRVWAATIAKGAPHPTEHAQLRWLTVDELHDVDWLPADLPIVERIAGMLLSGKGRPMGCDRR
jgi:8-oxo-dGTP diphosphatase